MSNSSLVTHRNMTSHYSGRAGYSIQKIFVHHMAGNLSVRQCGNVFKTREASAHYGIDGTGAVGQYVDEANASWHCGNYVYNRNAISIELANDGGAASDWHVSDKAIAKCIDLIVDICKRNGIKKINYTGNLNGNLCQHRWVASTACPGGYLAGKFPYIAAQVNKRLGAVSKPSVRIKRGQNAANAYMGSPKITATGYFDDNTKKQMVRCLQKGLNTVYKSKLTVDGLYGPKTDAAIGSRYVKRGDRNSLVQAMKIMLTCNGYDCGTTNNIYDIKTQGALTDFQKAKGLKTDGLCGKQTFKKLIGQ